MATGEALGRVERRWSEFSAGAWRSSDQHANHAVDYLAQLRSARTAETAIRPSIDNAQDLNIKDEPRNACISAPFLNNWPSWRREVVSQAKKIPGQKIKKNAARPKVLLCVSHIGMQAR